MCLIIIMSDHSEKSLVVNNSYFNNVSVTKLAGSLVALGLSASVGFYVYSKYYKQSDTENNKTSDEI
jgi:hypothetical protein